MENTSNLNLLLKLQKGREENVTRKMLNIGQLPMSSIYIVKLMPDEGIAGVELKQKTSPLHSGAFALSNSENQ